MNERLRDRVAFITGAARGQGRSHALRLAAEGADIIAVDVPGTVDSVGYPLGTAEELAETVRGVEELGRRVIARQADVRDFAALERVVAEGVSAFGRLDVVVANAGIGTMGPVWELSEQEWQDTIDVNLTGVWHTAKAAIPHIVAGGRGGSIILTSSSAGLKSLPNMGHYSASKHGVVGFMLSLALELAPHLIRVNSIHPTSVNTPMIHNVYTYAMFAPDVEEPAREQVAGAFQSVNALPIPWVEPEDVANAVAFLASDEARYMTGVMLPVDAGTVIKL